MTSKTNIKLIIDGEIKEIQVEKGSLISDIEELNLGHLNFLCAKKGICKKCLIKAVGQLSPPTSREAKLGNEIRLACTTKILGETTLTVLENSAQLQSAEKEQILGFSDNPLFTSYGVAIDIGTTTIAVSLMDESHKTATHSIKNPQVIFGADVISRIEKSMSSEDVKKNLAQSVKDGINQVIDNLCAENFIDYNEIHGATITGNTAMLHLLLEKDCTPLSKAPFEAEFLGGYIGENTLNLHINPDSKVLFPHCLSAFVGGDISTAILGSGLLDEDKTSLLVDIGTNGEMALFHGGKLHCCSTAAGPAFEGVGIHCGIHGVKGAIEHINIEGNEPKIKVIGGGEAKGICGSGVIDAVDALISLEVLDETGRLDEDDPRVVDTDDDLFFPFQDDIGIYGKDIRMVQLAKSAICAGITTLLNSCNINSSDLDTLYIAGGFGSFIDIQKAGNIGLIPKELCEKVKVIGNSALTGAQMLLVDWKKIETTSSIQNNAEIVDLASSKFFMEQYIENMYFE